MKRIMNFMIEIVVEHIIAFIRRAGDELKPWHVRKNRQLAENLHTMAAINHRLATDRRKRSARPFNGTIGSAC